MTDQTTRTTTTVPNLSGTSWTPTQALNLGDNYIWWVGGVQGKTIAWSDALTFTIQPTAIGPSGTITTAQPAFSWNSVTGAASYEIWLTDLTTGTTVTVPNISGTSWTPTQALDVGDNEPRTVREVKHEALLHLAIALRTLLWHCTHWSSPAYVGKCNLFLVTELPGSGAGHLALDHTYLK